MADRLLTLRAERSWFSKASASRHGLLSSPSSSSQHELPRWSSPSPMAASMIPPPIVQSTYARTPSALGSPSSVPIAASRRPDLPQSLFLPPQQQPQQPRPTPLQHRQNELQADLQFLLDAQAAALVHGLESGGVMLPDEQTSTGSTTPTAQSVRSASVSTRRTTRKSLPVRRTIGLRSARKGIYKSIVALSAVKDDEMQTLDEEVQETDRTLAQIAEWEQKRHGLQEATKSADEDEANVRAQRLRREADLVQHEINQVELQLMELKSKQRKMLRQASAAENAVQANRASYTSALSMLEADVQKFLSRQPSPSRHAGGLNEVRPSSSASRQQDGKTSIWELPAPRRTLKMARGQFADEREAVEQQRREVEREKTALDEGASMWKSVIAQVTDFEKQLRAEMAILGGGGASNHSERSAWDEEDETTSSDQRQHGSAAPEQRLKELLVQLNTVLDDLEAQFALAKEREYNLLIAAIGAELDALRRGKVILQGVLGITEVETQEAETGDGDAEVVRPDEEELVDTADTIRNTSDEEGAASSQSGGTEIHALDERFEEDGRRLNNDKGKERARDEDEDDDEDPDPELLFSVREES